MTPRIFLFLPITVAALAQPTVAPTNEPVGIVRGENAGGYNVRQSFELGYRYHTVGGNEDTYRSMVNFGNGVRLLGSSLSVNSLEGQGRFFDQLQLNTQGLGNDPYQNALFRVEKNRLYRYDLSWRSNAYYYPGLISANGAGYANTVRNFHDQDLILFPQSRLKFFLGYSRNSQTGPGISSVVLFQGTAGDRYPLATNTRRQQNEYRAGFEGTLAGWRLNAMHGWVNFKDDSPFNLPGPSQGANPNDLNTATFIQRNERYHGNSPYWRVALFKEARWWALNGRFTYVSGQRDFVQDQIAMGTNLAGARLTQQNFVMGGNAQRPATAADFNFSVFPSSKLTITNQTAISNLRISGSAVLRQAVNGILGAPSVPFEFLGIFLVSNSTDADYRPTTWFGLRFGYQYSNRRIRSIQVVNPAAPPPEDEQYNGMHTGRLGVRLRPMSGLTINLDGEIARADQPFFPISARNVEAFRGRVEYRRGDFRFAGFARTDYNLNSGNIYEYASRSRQYGIDGTWTISRTMYIDAGYAKLHLNSLGTLNYFVQNPRTLLADRSYYVSNLHTANVAAHFTLGLVDVSLGLTHVQDTGDSRATIFGDSGYGNLPPFQAAQTFPLRFTSPQGKVSVRIHEKLRWNVGYQRYAYAQEFSTAQNFRAHTGYTSVLWSF